MRGLHGHLRVGAVIKLLGNCILREYLTRLLTNRLHRLLHILHVVWLDSIVVLGHHLANVYRTAGSLRFLARGLRQSLAGKRE
jgi:hypothetical protein